MLPFTKKEIIQVMSNKEVISNFAKELKLETIENNKKNFKNFVDKKYKKRGKQ